MGRVRHPVRGFLARHCQRLRRDTSGVAAIELGLSLPILMLLGFGAVDGSLLVYQAHQIEQGLELGGAYLAKSPDPGRRAAEARNLAVTGRVSGGTPRVAGWDASHVRVSFRAGETGFRQGRAFVAVLESSHPYEGFGLLKGLWRGELQVVVRHGERVQ